MQRFIDAQLERPRRPGGIGAAVTAAASYFPSKVVPNSHFADYLDTSDEWIVSRTGIRERRVLEHGATSDMAAEAGRRALAQRGLSPSDLDLIVVATTTPDTFFPSTACLVQHKLGAPHVWGFDLAGACSGFLYALSTVCALVRAGVARRALLIGADKMSSILDMRDRATCVLFGDGAGAFLIEATECDDAGVRDEWHRVDGAGGHALIMPAGGSAVPASHESVAARAHYVRQDGPTVYKAAVRGMLEAARVVMHRNKLKPQDIDFAVPHQANIRIIRAVMSRLEIPSERVMINIDRYGNTTSATIPSCIAEYAARGILKRGDNLLLCAFGAGFSQGAAWLKWSGAPSHGA
jgi:3-oxoacyl-[acyl-carrier-protein] synthase III